MSRSILLWAAASVCLAAEPEKLIPIFDGRTLDGWEQKNGTAKFTVEDGAIVGTTAEGSANSFLCTKRPYGDFILELEVQNDPLLNSGIQIRSHQYARETEVLTENNGKRKRTHPAGRVYGYQVEISNEHGGTSGGIFEEARRGWLANISANPVASKAYRDNQWNKIRVAAIGDSIKTWVNGVLCADLVDSMEQSGFIGLQVHAFHGDKPVQVRFRNIRIQDLGGKKWASLEGWSPTGAGRWTITEAGFHGTADGEARGFLLSKDRFDDFAVRLKYKILKGNSGLFFRMAEQGAQGPVGYEVEIDPARDAGGLMEPRGRRWLVQPDPAKVNSYYKTGDWNELAVSAHGGRIVVMVNGERTVDLHSDPGRANGRFGLQLNSRSEMDVWFKDIQILR